MALQLDVVRAYRRLIGLDDNQMLESLVISVQQEALKTVNHRCVQEFWFLQPRMSSHPIYADVLQRFRSASADFESAGSGLSTNRSLSHIPGERSGTVEAESESSNGSVGKAKRDSPLFLDVGCCFGTDLRKLILDGVNPRYLLGLELSPTYIDLGWKLFGDSFPGNGPEVLLGDFLDLDSSQFSPKLAAAKGHVTALYAGSVLHLLSEEQVRDFVRTAHSFLAPGGVFFGRCVASNVPGSAQRFSPINGTGLRYLHSPESLLELLRSAGFEPCWCRMIDRPPEETSMSSSVHGVRGLMAFSAEKP